MKKHRWHLAFLTLLASIAIFVSCSGDKGNNPNYGGNGFSSSFSSSEDVELSSSSEDVEPSSSSEDVEQSSSSEDVEPSSSSEDVEQSSSSEVVEPSSSSEVVEPSSSSKIEPSSSSEVTVNFTIKSPYASINWDSYGQYKAALHTHTTNSDGTRSVLDVVDKYYELDYDILAITDHTWKRIIDPRNPQVEVYKNFITKSWTATSWDGKTNWTTDGETYYLSYITGTRLTEVTTGVGRGGKKMLAIPNTGELALQPGSDEINVFYYTIAAPTAWTSSATIANETKKASDAGALVYLNHPGRATGGRYDAAESNKAANIKKYADLTTNNSNVTGMEIFNRRDGDSKNDRILWDNVLTDIIPKGRYLWGFGGDDSHSHSEINVNHVMLLMPSNTDDNFKKAMKEGHSYTRARVAYNEGVDVPTDSPLPFPSIKKIEVNDKTGTITITAEDFTKIEWISKGVKVAEGATLQVGDYPGIDIYVRANIIGPGGIALTQPFGIVKPK